MRWCILEESGRTCGIWFSAHSLSPSQKNLPIYLPSGKWPARWSGITWSADKQTHRKCLSWALYQALWEETKEKKQMTSRTFLSYWKDKINIQGEPPKCLSMQQTNMSHSNQCKGNKSTRANQCVWWKGGWEMRGHSWRSLAGWVPRNGWRV